MFWWFLCDALYSTILLDLDKILGSADTVLSIGIFGLVGYHQPLLDACGFVFNTVERDERLS